MEFFSIGKQASMIGNSGSNINWIPEPNATAPATLVGGISYPAPMAQGWLCPRCKRVNSPMMMQCNCPAQAASQPANTDKIFISGVSASISGNLSVSGTTTYKDDMQISLT